MRIQINSKFQILLVLIASATAAFLQAPSNQFQPTFNSTFLTHQGKLHRPIVIPNSTEHAHTFSPNLKNVKTTDKAVLKNILQNGENYSGEEELRPIENRFSSRYSSKEQTVVGKADESEEKVTSITDIPTLLERGEPISSKISLPSPPNAKTFSDRLDVVNDSEEEEEEEEEEEKADGRRYLDSSEAREGEESEITSTTNEPYSELRTATSIPTSPDDHFENYETSSDESDDDSEEKRSLDDYHNSGSKNYHSIQTPLNRIKYRGPHGFTGDIIKIKKPNHRLGFAKQNWSNNRDKSENENEIEENKEWTSEEEQNAAGKDAGLELAVHNDEKKFNRTRSHNYIDEKRRRKEQEKNLAEEEEKDHRSPFYKTLNEYAVDEEEPKYQTTEKFAKIPKKKVRPTKKPKNIFLDPNPGTTKVNNSKELKLDFPIHRFLGPVVFDEGSKIQTTPKSHPDVVKAHRDYVKNLKEKEKVDEDHRRFQTPVLTREDAKYQTFNHLEESEEMYNAILANIQSVFGLRTQPLGGGGKNQPEVNLEESSAFTWSMPIIKRQVKSGATLRGSYIKVKSGSEERKSLFPSDVTQRE